MYDTLTHTQTHTYIYMYMYIHDMYVYNTHTHTHTHTHTFRKGNNSYSIKNSLIFTLQERKVHSMKQFCFALKFR